ncbi:TPA: hypothetical protein N0F65_006828 [Lagenidium giganteum]|uniref:Uncharacterized protein n=1 Tax=Lagenidium giganteum TaxID=4803 RepID=A0AAV2ZE99_9STRA|nr:TPA: hypothetical protein N0F65_006828 [Lagenidium giganteum]
MRNDPSARPTLAPRTSTYERPSSSLQRSSFSSSTQRARHSQQVPVEKSRKHQLPALHRHPRDAEAPVLEL